MLAKHNLKLNLKRRNAILFEDWDKCCDGWCIEDYHGYDAEWNDYWNENDEGSFEANEQSHKAQAKKPLKGSYYNGYNDENDDEFDEYYNEGPLYHDPDGSFSGSCDDEF